MIPSQLEDPRSIGHFAADNIELSQRAVVITIGGVKMIGAGEMRFARIRAELERRLDRRLGQGKALRSVIEQDV